MVEETTDYQEQLRFLKVQLELEKEHITQLEKLLNHDPDTGLLQKHVLIQRMRKTIDKGEPFCFAIIRLDRSYQRVKHTRDRMKVLLYVTAERIKNIVGEENLFQSDRSDEFLVILPETRNLKTVRKVFDEVTLAVGQYHNPPASDLHFGCHIGAAVYPDHGSSLEELQVNTEIALGIFEHKRDQGFIYSPEIGKKYHERESLDSLMNHCIRNNFEGFHIVYQPLMNREGKLVGCEALMRWDAPETGAVSPVQFIPMAEQSGAIFYLGRWILYHSMRQMKTWREEFGKELFVSINVSPIQLQGQNCTQIVRDTLEVLDLPGRAVHLEITESSIVEEPDKICGKLQEFRDLGIRIMLDDFGTGYSSLSYLNQFPIDTLKIAKEFIDDFPGNPKSMDMVRAILSLSKNFGFTTLAEGVEKPDQLKGLIEEGCNFIQGYHYSPPVSALEFEERFLQ